MREKVKNLWKLCFNDSDEFTDMYFRLRYSNDVNIAIQSGEEVIAALQMLPYPMTSERTKSRQDTYRAPVHIPIIVIAGLCANYYRRPLPVCCTMTWPFRP